jgi:ADP-heptose:LPS heptosyltransferase
MLAPLLTHKSLHQPGTDFLETQSRLFKTLGVARVNTTKRFEAVTNPNAVPMLDSGSWHVGLLVGSGRALKRVPLAGLTALVTQLVQSKRVRPVQVLLIGGPGDIDLAAQIKGGVPESLMDKVLDLSGQYPLAGLPSVLNQLDLLIGVDSGVTHMADALGVSILCIAGPVDLGEVYAPANAKRQFAITPLPCYPCSRVFDTPATCHQGTVACLTTLDPSNIAQKAIEMLDTNQHGAER